MHILFINLPAFIQIIINNVCIFTVVLFAVIVLRDMYEEKRYPFIYEGFNHSAADIASFAYFFDSFMVELKSGNVVRHRTADPEKFYTWLEQNKVKVNLHYIEDRIMPSSRVAYLLEPPLS